MARKPLPWFRMYASAATHDKTGLLSDAEFRTWIVCLCEASDSSPRGTLGTSVATTARALRVPARHIAKLIDAKLIDDVDGVLQIHNWKRRQYESFPNETGIIPEPNQNDSRLKPEYSRARSASASGDLFPEKSLTVQEFRRGQKADDADARAHPRVPWPPSVEPELLRVIEAVTTRHPHVALAEFREFSAGRDEAPVSWTASLRRWLEVGEGHALRIFQRADGEYGMAEASS